MLVMRRREGEAVLIGDDVEIRILSIHRSKVKIGINAPRSISVCAQEVELVRQENLVAAQSAATLSVNDAPDIMTQLMQVLQPGAARTSLEQVADMRREGLQDRQIPDVTREAPCPAQ